MFLSRIVLGTALLFAATTIAACRDRGDDDAVASDTTGGPPGDPSSSTPGDTGDPDDTGEPDAPTQAASLHAGVKRKAPEVYARDLAAALELDVADLCRELSLYDCTDAHRIALGGVAPYERAVYEPLAEPGIGSPLAVDRIALSACGERVARDLAGDPRLFAEIVDGDATSDDRAVIVDRLVLRLLRRTIEPHEREALVALADDPSIPDLRTWGQLACFAVATTLENVFY